VRIISQHKEPDGAVKTIAEIVAVYDVKTEHTGHEHPLKLNQCAKPIREAEQKKLAIESKINGGPAHAVSRCECCCLGVN
jgi:hypothetical protein